MVPQSHILFVAGLKPGKGYGLADCISMQTLRRDDMTDILTDDRHFEQEGFRALVRS